MPVLLVGQELLRRVEPRRQATSYAPAPGSGGSFWELDDDTQGGSQLQELRESTAEVAETRDVLALHASTLATQLRPLWGLPGGSFFSQPAMLLPSDTARHVTAGTLARTLAQAAIHPIDTVKTRLQINKSTAPEQLRMWRHTTKCHPVDFHVGRQRVLHMRNVLIKGPRDIYLGLAGAVFGTIPTALVYFATYEGCKARLEKRRCGKAATHLLSASAGAMLSALVRVPADTLKHRTQAYLVPSCWTGAQSIVRAEGWRGLYHGLLPTLLRDVPEIAIQFFIYEALREALQGRRGVSKLRTWEHLGLGGLSGACAATVTTPLDCAKTALQCGVRAPLPAVMARMLEARGPAGLFAGMGPRVTQTAICSALFFVLFEAAKGQLKRERLPEDRMQPKLWTKRRHNVWKRQVSQV